MASEEYAGPGIAALRIVADPKLYEFLYKVVAEAQASGAVVIVTTIIPPAQTTVGDGLPTIESCMPGESTCPK